MASSVLVHKTALKETRICDKDLPPLEEGAVRLKIESFSITANNITYAVTGDLFGYWNFFPGDGEWGIVPVWGHARVEQSRHPEIAVGERVYGYLPMATHLDVLPGKLSSSGFIDMAAHRQPMSPIYNQYSRLNADPEHDATRERERMLFGPLFKTGFLIEAMFRRESWFGAEVLIMTSASSKTSMGLASVARDLSPDIKRIGLTSKGNCKFVRETGLYDQVLDYDEVTGLPQTPSVLVDFAGSQSLLRNIHEVLGEHLKYSCLVGATHADARGLTAKNSMKGPAPILFFAPDHAVATINELGAKGFGDAVAISWASFLNAVDGTIDIDEQIGLEAAARAFERSLSGQADAQKGIIIRP
ncbi:MAG: DUF2855 family protein [Sphingorhabdus sp.]